MSAPEVSLNPPQFVVSKTRASLVAQMVKNPPTVWETWVQSLIGEDALEKGKATNSSILAWRIPTDRGVWWATVHRVAKDWTQLSTESAFGLKGTMFLFLTTHLARTFFKLNGTIIVKRKIICLCRFGLHVLSFLIEVC